MFLFSYVVLISYAITEPLFLFGCCAWWIEKQVVILFIYLFFCNVLFCSIYVNLNVWLYTWLVSFLSLEPKQKTAYLTINILIYVWIIYVTSDIHILSISIFDLHKETKTKVLYLAGH